MPGGNAIRKRTARTLLVGVCILVLACAIGVCRPAFLAGADQPEGGSAVADEPAAPEPAEPAAEPAAPDDDASARTIRVAFPQQPLVTEAGQDGARSGYTYEYLERLAQYTGWKYEYVAVEGSGADAFMASLDLLRAGKVDLVSGVIASAQNRSEFSLTRESFATLGVVLKANAARAGSFLESAGQDAVLRVAAVGGSVLNEDLAAFCEQSGIAYETVACANAAEARSAVDEGRADVLLSTDMTLDEGMRTVAHVSSRPLYFAVASADQLLADRLDTALMRVDEVDATFRTQLHSAYFSTSAVEFALTDEERAYVASAGTLRVGVLTDQPPYQYEEDGELKGIAVDMLETVAAKTGLSFAYVPADTQDELDELRDRGEIDMEAGVDFSYEAARESSLSLTQPYVMASYVLVASESVGEGDLAGRRLALVANSQYNGMFVGDVHRFATVSACLRAVFNGDADYTYVDEYVMQYFLNTPEFRDVRIAPQTHQPRRVSFGVAQSADTMLLGIMDKAVGSLTELERQAVINNNVLRERPLEVADYVRAHPMETFLVVAGVCLLVLLLVLVILFQRARANAKTALDLKKRLQLYALCDDFFFEYDRRANTLLLSMPGRDGSLSEPLRMDMDPVASGDKAKRAEFLAVLRSEARQVEELQLPDADGIEHWLRVTVEPVSDHTGHLAFSVGKIEVIDDERRAIDQLVAKAEHDSLTGLLNSETTRLRVSQQLAALQPGWQGALLMIDIDFFKEVNDTYGHLQGDRVLMDVARILRESFRVGDVVGRLGGDEFMVYMSAVSDETVVKAKGEAVRKLVERHAFAGASCRVTVSVGAVLSRAGDGFDDLYCRADEALYAAKGAGRNRCAYETAAPSGDA